MRAAVYYNNRDVRIEELQRPAIGPGELLVKIVASGICGSDLLEWYRLRKAPLVLGHEIAGTVAEVGEEVQGFAVGDRVFVSPPSPATPAATAWPATRPCARCCTPPTSTPAASRSTYGCRP